VNKNNHKISLSIAAIGIVYGDIGTSPLYAFRESLAGIPLIESNILGILSLIFWSLILIITIKYLVLVLQADNKGEGGILAALALLKKSTNKALNLFFFIAIAGTALLISDGMITPAISVISALEGIKLVFPTLSYLTIPATLLILVILFLHQHHGTAKIGSYFGPIMLFWFLSMAALGALHAIENPQIFAAINPYYGLNFFIDNGYRGYATLASVFLAVTGGEALYADLGQFGKGPIRFGWFSVVLPCLLLNYFGQGAYLLRHPEAISNPFYSLSPSWFFYPLLILATMATIIASQAVIAATFSLANQAILLDLYPKIPVIQTSAEEKGQVYVPQMNFFLACGSLALVVFFKSSSGLAQAYGIAVNLVMISVTLLVAALAYKYWKWSLTKTVVIFFLFFFIEFAFLGANAHKILTGGWVPILFALLFSLIMITWHKGVNFLRASYYAQRDNFPPSTLTSQVFYLPNILAVFIIDPYDKSAGSLFKYLKLNLIMPENSIILSVKIEDSPYVNYKRFDLVQLENNVYRLQLYYGFKEVINIPQALSDLQRFNICPISIDLTKIIYLIENTQILTTTKKATLPFFWQEKLFAFLLRNSNLNIEFYELPHDHTVAIGCYFEI
jgi:KUP system potassium uptake protein